MTIAQFSKFLVVLAGAALAAGSTSARLQEAPAAAAQQGGEQSAQEPEEFRLTQRERVGREGQQLRVGDTRVIFNSIFEFDETANDLFVWGWLPTISGDIGDNAFLGGQKIGITPDGSIGGDLFIFAQTAHIEGHVGGDVYSFVADMVIGESATVDGAMIGSSGALTIDGEVGGPLNYAGGVVRINGTVRGDVSLEAGELELGPDAVIEGELRYESPREATIAPGADVQGGLRYFAPRADREDEAPTVTTSSWRSVWNLFWDAWWLLSSFLVGAIALAFGGEPARRPAERLASQPALGLGFGFVIAVVIPAAAILAMVLLVTIPLGLIGMAVYFAAAYLARLVAAQTVGELLLRKLRGGAEVSAYASLALGLVLFFFLTQIPYVGFLIWLAAVVAGLGGIFLATRKGEMRHPDDPLAAAPANT